MCVAVSQQNIAPIEIQLKMWFCINYFTNLEAKCYFLKIRCSKSSFLKKSGCQYNLQ